MKPETLRVKITIADRVYPMTIAPDQEEGLRRAAKEIEQVIRRFEKSYAVRDKQDVLAMCALQFAAQSEQVKKESLQELGQLESRLKRLDDNLASKLNLY